MVLDRRHQLVQQNVAQLDQNLHVIQLDDQRAEGVVQARAQSREHLTTTGIMSG